MEDQAHLFTKEELERWVESVGGIGAEVIIPEDAYWIDGQYRMRLHMTNDQYFVGKKAKIIGVVETHWHAFLVRLLSSNKKDYFDRYFLWPAMRDAKLKVPIVLYPNKCKKCSWPSRQCDGYIFCSNAKCKTRKKIKYIKTHAPVIEYGTKENPFEARCPECYQLCEDIGFIRQVIICPVHGDFSYKVEANKYYIKNDGVYLCNGNNYGSIWTKIK